MRTSIWTTALLCVALSGCVEEDKTAEQACDNVPVCPAGTSIDLTATSVNECSGSLGIDTEAFSEELKASGGCYAQGSCVYRCSPVSNCCGEETWTATEYKCSTPCGATACGDNVCQAGEVCQAASCSAEQLANGQCSLCQEDCCGVCGDGDCGINLDLKTGISYAESANSSDEHYCPSDCGNQICQTQCAGKQCGDDTCGGSCGTCTSPHFCNDSGQCVCIPECDNKVCGSDGCGQECGQCKTGQGCTGGQCVKLDACGNGACESNENEDCASCPKDCACADNKNCTADGDCCSPNCKAKTCGDDGCGGSCGSCEGLQDCDESGQCQECKPKCIGNECGSDGCGGVCGDCKKMKLEDGIFSIFEEYIWQHINNYPPNPYEISAEFIPVRAQKITAPVSGFLKGIMVPLSSDNNIPDFNLLQLFLYNIGPGGSFEAGELSSLLNKKVEPDCAGTIDVNATAITPYVVMCTNAITVNENDRLWLALRWHSHPKNTGSVSWVGSEQDLSLYGTEIDSLCCKGSPIECLSVDATSVCGGSGKAHDLGFSLLLKNHSCDSTQQCISIGN